MNARTALVLGMTACARSSAAVGQTVLHVYTETEPHARAGESVAIWDDADGDGFREWAVGVPRRDGVGNDSGQVMVFSGSDHSLLTTIDGAVAGARLGQSIANVGDLNLDGKDELAVGAPGERKVYVHSGADGTLLWSAHEPGDNGFGGCVSPAGDADADGVLDVAASARGVSVIVTATPPP